MKHASHLFIAACVLALSAPLPALAMSEAYDCNQDPIYARSLSGQTNVGSRVRSSPCMVDNVMTVLPQNTKLQIIAETDGWYKVKAGDVTGWIGATLISQTDKPAISAETKVEVKPVVSGSNESYKIPIGVSESNYYKLKAGNAWLVKKLNKKVIMRVESRGQKYYVNGYGTVKQLMNKEQEKQYLEVANQGAITLKAAADEGGVRLNWIVEGVAAPNGFKIVKSAQPNPVYPGNDYHYLSDPKVRADEWDKLPSGTYYFRVCQYLGGKCGVYSNNVAVKVVSSIVENEKPIIISNTNGKITLTGAVVNGAAKLNWSLADMTSPKGFKIVVAETANPVYPGNTYHYLSDPAVRSDAWTDLKAGKTYHFRVCEYLGGACGVYSNDVTVSLPATVTEPMTGTGAINLTGSVVNGTVNLNWTLNGMTSPKGFKVVTSPETNPVYPGNTYHYLSNPDVRVDAWTDLGSGTKHFRVCEYLGGACGAYSNDLVLVLP